MIDDEHGGYPLGNPFRRRHEADDPLGASNETPVDLAAVQADDALLDKLRNREFDDLLERADARYNHETVAYAEMRLVLARVLVAWRRDVDSEPVPVLIADGYRLPFRARVRAAVRGFFRLGGKRWTS